MTAPKPHTVAPEKESRADHFQIVRVDGHTIGILRREDGRGEWEVHRSIGHLLVGQFLGYCASVDEAAALVYAAWQKGGAK